METYIFLAAFMFASVVLGIGVGYILFHRKSDNPVGSLHVETSDPDGPYIFLELNRGVGDVMQKDKVVLDVITKSYISQE